MKGAVAKAEFPLGQFPLGQVESCLIFVEGRDHMQSVIFRRTSASKNFCIGYGES